MGVGNASEAEGVLQADRERLHSAAIEAPAILIGREEHADQDQAETGSVVRTFD